MRIASRHMPKFKRRPIGPVSYMLLATFAGGLLYVAISAPTFTAVSFLLVCFCLLLAHNEVKRDAERLRVLAASREGESICEFAKEFDVRSVDTWIVRAVYEQIQQQLQHVHSAFPVRASDLLKEDLHLDDDDLDLDLALEIEQRTGRSLENSRANPYAGKVKTVRDLVMFFQAQSKQSTSAQ